MASADATVVVPMDFLRVPLSAVAGWLLYSEGIDIFLAAGAGLILFANLLNLKGSGTTGMRGMPTEAQGRQEQIPSPRKGEGQGGD